MDDVIGFGQCVVVISVMYYGVQMLILMCDEVDCMES